MVTPQPPTMSYGFVPPPASTHKQQPKPEISSGKYEYTNYHVSKVLILELAKIFFAFCISLSFTLKYHNKILGFYGPEPLFLGLLTLSKCSLADTARYKTK